MTWDLVKSALLVALAACHAHEVRSVADARECPSTSCDITSKVAISPAFSPQERDDVRAGVAVWVEAAGGRLCVEYVGMADGPYVTFRRAARAVEFAHVDINWRDGHIGFWDGRGNAWVIPHPKGQRLDGMTTTSIAAHEMGHALGMRHSDPEPASLMLSEGGGLTEDGSVWPSDRAAFCRVYSCRCAR